ncbi:MAG: MxaS protein [Piscinibacter sp.]|uniref:DUF58 domain-containing protein n=1 Tax=Piscinibacter TaxID=1114981 RepID=UPI00197BA69B|nr:MULTISPECIES: MxaS protein [Piscinibacter]MCW5664401.1 MxaS protein [Piscinibacter sp.]
MAPNRIPEVHYRIPGLAGGGFPGHHRSRSGEGGFEFRRHAALADAPDARRLDLHASLRDPFGQWLVRINSLRQAVPVAVVADLSASMGFAGVQRKLDVLADFTRSIAWSAWRTGDSFAFVGADQTLRRDWLLPATRQRGAGLALAERLRGFEPTGRSARGLREAAVALPHRRALVFLVSDFHLPLPELREVLDALSHHALVPVLLWQPEEFEPAAAHGLVQVVDPESGRRRWLWWRPALRERWRVAREQRRAELLNLFAQRRLAPLIIDGAFDADAVTRHFLA